MKKTIVALFLCFLSMYSLFSENEITVFEGGNHQLDLSFYSTFFMGTTARSRSFGNSISSSLYDTHLISANPAGMAIGRKNLLSFDLAPGFGFDINNLYSGLQDKVDEAVDDAIEKDESPNIQKSYPKLKTDIGQSGWINQFGLIIYDKKYGSFGFSWNRPFYLNMNYIGNALNFTVEDIAVKDEGTDDEYEEYTVLPLSIELFSNTNINMHQSNFAYAKNITNELSVGLGMNLSRVEMKNSLTSNIGGFIRQYGGDTDIYVAFDDPNIEYRNTMNSFVDIDFSGNFTGFVMSANWLQNENWLFDVAFNSSKSKDLKGSLHIVQHTLGALNLNAEDDEDTFDVELLQPAKIAYTNKTEYKSKDMKLSIPGHFALSSTYINEDFKFIFSYEKPFGELSLDYKCIRYKNGEKKIDDVFVAYADTTHLAYKVGIKPKHTVKLAFGWTHFAVSAQLTFADIIADNVKDSDGKLVEASKNVPIPGLAIGTGFSISNNTLIDFNIIALPSPFFRTSVTWKF